MSENVVSENSYWFALRIIRLDKYIIDGNANLGTLSLFFQDLIVKSDSTTKCVDF